MVTTIISNSAFQLLVLLVIGGVGLLGLVHLWTRLWAPPQPRGDRKGKIDDLPADHYLRRFHRR